MNVIFSCDVSYSAWHEVKSTYSILYFCDLEQSAFGSILKQIQ
jgi:hypothetical protein